MRKIIFKKYSLELPQISIKNFIDWIGIYPYFRAPNLHCYEKICTITDISIFYYYFINCNKPDDGKAKGYAWY